MCAVRIAVNSWNTHHKCQAQVGKYPVFGRGEEAIGKQMLKPPLFAQFASKAVDDIDEEQPFGHADTIGDMPDPGGSGKIVDMVPPVEH
jgi:hypothetical protein